GSAEAARLREHRGGEVDADRAPAACGEHRGDEARTASEVERTPSRPRSGVPRDRVVQRGRVVAAVEGVRGRLPAAGDPLAPTRQRELAHGPSEADGGAPVK